VNSVTGLSFSPANSRRNFCASSGCRPPFAQRRQNNFHDAQAKEQILAEGSDLGEVLQVFVPSPPPAARRRSGFVRADALERAFAEEPEQF